MPHCYCRYASVTTCPLPPVPPPQCFLCVMPNALSSATLPPTSSMWCQMPAAFFLCVMSDACCQLPLHDVECLSTLTCYCSGSFYCSLPPNSSMCCRMPTCAQKLLLPPTYGPAACFLYMPYSPMSTHLRLLVLLFSPWRNYLLSLAHPPEVQIRNPYAWSHHTSAARLPEIASSQPNCLTPALVFLAWPATPWKLQNLTSIFWSTLWYAY